MVPVAGRQVAACLGNSDDRTVTVKLGERQAEIHVPLEVKSGHGRIAWRVEPFAAAQTALSIDFLLRGHRFPPIYWPRPYHAGVRMLQIVR